MARTSFIGGPRLFLLASHIGAIGHLPAQIPARRTRSPDRSRLRGRAAGREATGVWLLQRRHGHRPSFQSGIRLLAFARVSKQEGCGRGQECDRNRGGGRRASVALRIRSPKLCPARRRSDCHRRSCSFPQQRATLRCSLTLSCGPATIRGCIRTRAPKAGTCWRESSAWRRRLAPTGLGQEGPCGGIEYSNGAERHGYDPPACVRPGHP